MLNERLLSACDDEVESSLQTDIQRLTAKKSQLENTLAALQTTFATQLQHVNSARAYKDALGEEDLHYRKDNFQLYHSIFDFEPMRQDGSVFRFFHHLDGEEDYKQVGTYHVDFDKLESRINERHAHADKLLQQSMDLDATPATQYAGTLTWEAMQATRRVAHALERLRKKLLTHQKQIFHAIEMYHERLGYLNKLTDELDYNETLLRRVMADITNLYVMQERINNLEDEKHDSPRFR